MALLAAVAAASCAPRLNAGGGTVRLSLDVAPGGPSVSSVHWQILSASSAVLKAGDVDTTDVNATVSVDTSCPAGSGDRVMLSATTSDGQACAGQSGTFNVVAGASVMVGVQLICGGGVSAQPNGSVVVGGQVVAGDNCPVLTNWEASPLEATSGAQINVSASATDADVGQTLTYSWIADSGGFTNQAAPTTTYTCGFPTLSPGGITRFGPTHTLTVTVTDNYAPTPCSASVSFSIDCVEPGECGDLIIEPGEQCDPPNGTNCTATCQFQAFCGDGIVTPPETCDPNNTASTYGTPAAHCSFCQTIPYCGDGHVDTSFGETCDPPDRTSCDANCHVVCVGFSDSACTLCEQADTADCPASLNQVPRGCIGWGCFGFAGKSLTDCQALLACTRTQHCANGDDPTPCLCGSLTAGACASSGAPADAPCAAQYAAAAADAPGTVFQQFDNPSTPVGIANNQTSCEVDSACACP